MSDDLAFIDTETCGLCGPAIILQYAFGDGPINIHNFWTSDVGSSIELIELIASKVVVGFNLAFDWFQLAKMYTMLERFVKLYGDTSAIPEDHIEKFAELEADARFGSCIKPKSAIDLMLVARKTKYQITMNRGDIKIRKVPTLMAGPLAKHLEKEIVLQNILFARRKDKYAPRWRVFDRTKRVAGKNVNDPEFKDVVLKFRPSVALKALAIDALGVQDDNVLLFKDIEIGREWLPNEIPYAPFAKAVREYKLTSKNKGQKEAKKIYAKRNFSWRWAWPDVIHKHISHWEHYQPARDYAAKDIEYTRGLYRYFDCPVDGDDDSVLACMVGAVRWRGYAIDVPGLTKLRDDCETKIKARWNSPVKVRNYLNEVLSPEEREILKDGTGKNVLKVLAARVNQTCPSCELFGEIDKECEVCKGTNRYTHPVAPRAQEILDARFSKKEKELYDKLILAGRFHASFKVIGALSSRMAGADGLNAQGIKRDKFVRKNFTFADEGAEFHGGDFDAFEPTIADAIYDDPDLRKALKAGKKLHAIFAMDLKAGLTYEDVMNSRGQVPDYYDMGKRGLLGQLYGGDYNTLVNHLGVSVEVAQRCASGFVKRYPGVARARQRIIADFCSMKQPKGIGTKVEWHEPKDYVESLFGFRRYFTLENMVCKSLFNLAAKPPKEWKALGSRIKVVRRDREQTGSGALASALYGAAFQLQASSMRAAANHEIQSSGATITKSVQRKVWDIQPSGVNKWLVQPCNVHDEILAVVDPSVKDQVKNVVNAGVETFRPRVPLIKMEWHEMKTWADK